MLLTQALKTKNTKVNLMLVFNCTKAAAEFFSIKQQGKKVTCIEPAPHKTISESIKSPTFPDDVDPKESGNFQWQWVVHCVSIKHKKYLLVMDYQSRFCITLLAGRKGDQYAFLNAFEPMLKASFHHLALEQGVDTVEIERYIDAYDDKVSSCAFHARSDRSVQGHLNDVSWHLKRHCYEDGMLLEDIDLVGFNLFTGQFPRNSKDKKDSFFPYKEFMHSWLTLAIDNTDVIPNNIVVLSHYRK